MDEYELILLASLLHDLGKFWQRTGQRHSASYAMFDERDYGPHGAHAKWSADFIERFLPAAWRPAARGALFHHRPHDYVTKLVAVADWLSSGERDDVDIDAGVQASQLLTLFARLRPDAAVPAPAPHYYGLEPLALTEQALFPRPDLLAAAERQAAYTRLWDGFVAELSQVPTDAFAAYFATLYYLLQKYTWAVPSAFYRSVPDVSLFDHARTTCAIAAALYRSRIAEAELDALLAREPAAWETPRLLLLGGDITGVQAFLYTITARGAARGLRGRSFYLQLVGEAIARWLLRRLGLPLPNLLYVGGGRFYLLAPLLPEAEIAQLRADLDRRLLRCHQGELYVALGAQPLAARDLRLEPRAAGRDFGALWAAVGQELDRQKRRKFASLPPAELHAAVFAPQGMGGSERGCVVCRREGPYPPGPPAAPEERKCALCLRLEELGADLREARYLYLGQVDEQLPAGPARDYQDTLRALGLELRLFADGAALRRAAPTLGAGTLYTLQDTHFLNATTRAAAEAAGRELALGYYLLANVTPHTADGAIADFADLARAAQGVRRLGVLRMDVDDLGALFGRGLGELATLSRMAHLSFLLRLYFEGWLAVLARQHNAPAAPADTVYVIYSGGDDLFIVGAWDQLPSLAQAIRRDFGRFAAGNPALHLSGGLSLEEEHFPLYQAAERAGAALERAKARQANGRIVKDALDLLGYTVSWDDLAAAAARASDLRALVEEQGVPRALIHALAQIARLYEAARAQPRRRATPAGQVPYGRWMWVAAYMLTRLAERLHPPAQQQVAALPQVLLQPQAIRTLGLAARWAELLVRKEEER